MGDAFPKKITVGMAILPSSQTGWLTLIAT